MIMARGRIGQLLQSDAVVIQAIWDRLMMIDLYPMNAERFNLDVHGIVRQALSFSGQKRNDVVA
jgi:hypothetical protein